MEEFSPPNKMLDRLATIHPVVWATAQPEKNSGAPPWLAYLHRRSASKRSLDVPALRLHAPALKLLPLPARCYNGKAKAATEPDASRNRARKTPKAPRSTK